MAISDRIGQGIQAGGAAGAVVGMMVVAAACSLQLFQ